MTQAIQLVAQARENVGKGSARAERRTQNIPAVIYGGKAAPAPISVEEKVLTMHINKKAFFTTLFDIEIDGKKATTVLPRDVQYHPVTDRALHVDFLRVTKTTKVKVQIPVVFTNREKSPGLKRGGSLNVVAREVEALCSAMAIPDYIEVSLEGYVLADTVRLSDLVLPKGVKLMSKDMNMTVASIAVPSALRSKVREEAKAAGDNNGENTAEEAK